MRRRRRRASRSRRRRRRRRRGPGGGSRRRRATRGRVRPRARSGGGTSRLGHPSGTRSGCFASHALTSLRLSQLVKTRASSRRRNSALVSGSRRGPGARQKVSIAARSYVFPLPATNTGSRNIARVIGHVSSSGSSAAAGGCWESGGGGGGSLARGGGGGGVATTTVGVPEMRGRGGLLETGRRRRVGVRARGTTGGVALGLALAGRAGRGHREVAARGVETRAGARGGVSASPRANARKSAIYEGSVTSRHQCRRLLTWLALKRSS